MGRKQYHKILLTNGTTYFYYAYKKDLPTFDRFLFSIESSESPNEWGDVHFHTIEIENYG